MTPMLTLRPDLQITGIDWRACDPRPQTTIIRGDVLRHDWPEHVFDAVVGISSIEHIGLGHYDGDPLDVDGDRHCMERVAMWLTPGGVMYLDVPFHPDHYSVEGTSHRCYDHAALRGRLLVPGLTLQHLWYARTDGSGLQTDPPTHAVSDSFSHYVALIATKTGRVVRYAS